MTPVPGALLWGLAVFCFVSSITPGPNNIMLMTSGVNFGVRRTLPHMLGVGLGFTAMVAGVGLGLAGIIVRYPGLLAALRWVGAAYMVWLAVKLARAAPLKAGDARGRPVTLRREQGNHVSFGDWADVDLILVDLPPGTGDVQLSLVQKAKPVGAVVRDHIPWRLLGVRGAAGGGTGRAT